jgi:hypothetical protein
MYERAHSETRIGARMRKANEHLPNIRSTRRQKANDTSDETQHDVPICGKDAKSQLL